MTPGGIAPPPRALRTRWRLIVGCFAGIGTSMVAYASMDGMLVPLQDEWRLSVDAISILSLSVLVGSMLLLLPAGELVDRWGSRKALLWGAAAAVVGAAVVMAALSANWLIAGRILGGLGGTAMTVASMALLNRSFTDDRERSYVFGLFAAVTSAIFAALPLLASVISDLLSWRVVPLTWIACATLAVALVPRDTSEPAARGELVTPLAAGVGLSALSVAVLTVTGSARASAAFLAVAAAAAAVVVLRRRWLRGRGRMSGLDLSVFRAPGAISLMSAMIAVALVNLFLYGNLLLQYRFGLLPTEAAIVLLVPQTAGILGGLVGGWASARLGSLPVTAIALALGCAAGLALQAMHVDSPVSVMVLPVSMFSVAAGCITGSLAKAFLDCADPASSGAAASWRQIGWSLGAAIGGVVTSTIVLGHFTRTLSAALSAAGVDGYVAQWAADAVRAGVPVASLTSHPVLSAAARPDAADSLVGLAAAQVDTFRLVGALAALTYAVALAFVLLALWRQRRAA